MMGLREHVLASADFLRRAPIHAGGTWVVFRAPHTPRTQIAGEIETTVTPDPRTCSRCSSTDDLHLVVLPLASPEPPGRVLSYCHECRQWVGPLLFDAPLHVVDADLLCSIYENGTTNSNPSIAITMVFGETNAPHQLVEKLEAILRARTTAVMHSLLGPSGNAGSNQAINQERQARNPRLAGSSPKEWVAFRPRRGTNRRSV